MLSNYNKKNIAISHLKQSNKCLPGDCFNVQPGRIVSLWNAMVTLNKIAKARFVCNRTNFTAVEFRSTVLMSAPMHNKISEHFSNCYRGLIENIEDNICHTKLNIKFLLKNITVFYKDTSCILVLLEYFILWK